MFRLLVLFRLSRIVLVSTVSCSQSSFFRLKILLSSPIRVYTFTYHRSFFFFPLLSVCRISFDLSLSICTLYVLEIAWFIPPSSFETLLWTSLSAERCTYWKSNITHPLNARFDVLIEATYHLSLKTTRKREAEREKSGYESVCIWTDAVRVNRLRVYIDVPSFLHSFTPRSVVHKKEGGWNERNDTGPRPRLLEKRSRRQADTMEVERKEVKLVNTINERTQRGGYVIREQQVKV
jgi:hypothetical protein